MREKHNIVVYVAGPYSAGNMRGTVLNIRKAELVSEELWKQGYTVFCPHMNSRLLDGIIPHDEWYKRDLVILKRCDVVVLLPGWQFSKGTRIEKEFAEKHNIPVVEWNEWGKYKLENL